MGWFVACMVAGEYKDNCTEFIPQGLFGEALSGSAEQDKLRLV
jgi:hypothetical protein